ncbi:MAG: MFS transporter [Carboxylicivirga sp.]|jgi:MFS family permease|nr:MFS transporter [Carboxylicivirga sp.]
MTLKRTILVLIAFSTIPLLQGFDTTANHIYKYLLTDKVFNELYFKVYDLAFNLMSALGLLIGGLAVDKWNIKRLVTINVIGLSLVSLVLQFTDSIVLIVVQRLIMAFVFGSLIMSFKVLLTDMSMPGHRGKILFAFLGVGTIGGLVFYVASLLEPNNINVGITYAQFQIATALLPLLLLFISRYMPARPERHKIHTFKYLFKPQQRIILLVMIVFALLISFANSNLFFYVASHIAFEEEIYYSNIIPQVIGLLALISGILSIDRFGRLGLLKIGFIALITSAVANIIVSVFVDQVIVVYVFLNLYQFLYSYTVASTVIILVLEYLPGPVRGRGMVLLAFTWWLPDILNNYMNSTLIFHSDYNVAISSVIIIVVLISVRYMLQGRLLETNGLKPDEIKSKLNIE